jgi:hypothetical protein
MTPEKGPLERPVSVIDLPERGLDVTVAATPDECAALARDFGLPAIHSLTGTFHLSGTARRVHVAGRINASISQICVVTLDSFDSDVEEDVEVDFAAEPVLKQSGEQPDKIVDGTIDLGALTAEFLALGLDPYPRKPGVDFTFESEEKPDSPFAALRRLKRDQ